MIEIDADGRSFMGRAGRNHMIEVFDKKKVIAPAIFILFAKMKLLAGIMLNLLLTDGNKSFKKKRLVLLKQ